MARSGRNRSGTLVYRHSGVVRVTHWVNVLCMTVLLMSGLQIFNAHPALYWGEVSDFRAPLAVIGDVPGWATIPSWQSLALGRRWHFFFAWLWVANGVLYLGWSLASRHLEDALFLRQGGQRQHEKREDDRRKPANEPSERSLHFESFEAGAEP